jgi:predicted 3-demethylubiquinone-9 3-methyltransferase (glyoxalase superfamily)
MPKKQRNFIYLFSKFKNTRYYPLRRVSRRSISGRPKGTVMTVTFELEGQQFMALNGGLIFKFSPAISFLVSCETQQEVDGLWENLSEEGQQEQCGWLKDKFGVSWQIVPTILGEMIQDKDVKKSERVIKAMLQMKKIDIQGLKKAYEEVDRRP